MPIQSPRTGNCLRAAVAAGDWPLVEQVLNEFRHEIEMAWASATTDDERATLKEQVFETMEWARRTAISARSRDQQTLLRLVHGSAYAEAHPRPEIFRLDV